MEWQCINASMYLIMTRITEVKFNWTQSAAQIRRALYIQLTACAAQQLRRRRMCSLVEKWRIAQLTNTRVLSAERKRIFLLKYFQEVKNRVSLLVIHLTFQIAKVDRSEGYLRPSAPCHSHFSATSFSTAWPHQTKGSTEAPGGLNTGTMKNSSLPQSINSPIQGFGRSLERWAVRHLNIRRIEIDVRTLHL